MDNTNDQCITVLNRINPVYLIHTENKNHVQSILTAMTYEPSNKRLDVYTNDRVQPNSLNPNHQEAAENNT